MTKAANKAAALRSSGVIAAGRGTAGRGTARSGSRRRPAQKPAQGRGGRKVSRGPLFHAPSFSAGVVLGAIVVLTAAYAPEFFSSAPAERPADAPAAAPEVTFEFDNLLRNSQVSANPEAYVAEGAEEQAGSIEYLIQAASFRREADAETLRARLLLQDLPAQTTSTRLDNAVWYRVTVGPFDSQVVAQRAMTRLREQNLDALWIRRRKPT